MNQHLKLCSGTIAVKKFKRAGWMSVRQSGSHVMLVKIGYRYTLSIPQHKELGVGILRKLLKQADLALMSLTRFNGGMKILSSLR